MTTGRTQLSFRTSASGEPRSPFRRSRGETTWFLRSWNPVTGQEKHYGLIVDYVGLGSQIASELRDAEPERGGRRPVDVEGLFDRAYAYIRENYY